MQVSVRLSVWRRASSTRAPRGRRSGPCARTGRSTPAPRCGTGWRTSSSTSSASTRCPARRRRPSVRRGGRMDREAHQPPACADGVVRHPVHRHDRRPLRLARAPHRAREGQLVHPPDGPLPPPRQVPRTGPRGLERVDGQARRGRRHLHRLVHRLDRGHGEPPRVLQGERGRLHRPQPQGPAHRRARGLRGRAHLPRRPLRLGHAGRVRGAAASHAHRDGAHGCRRRTHHDAAPGSGTQPRPADRAALRRRRGRRHPDRRRGHAP